MKLCKYVLVFLLAVAVMLVAARTFYVRAGTIVGVEYDNDLYIIEDEAGLVWLFGGVEDLSCGDNVAMLMWNKLTPSTIFDDVVIEIA
jgi:hypothetical protein